MSSGWQKADLKACLLQALVEAQGLKSISPSAGDLLRFTFLITRALKTSLKKKKIHFQIHDCEGMGIH